jgi:hypothetical protein
LRSFSLLITGRLQSYRARFRKVRFLLGVQRDTSDSRCRFHFIRFPPTKNRKSLL